jgi:hypothetical protein
VLRREEIGRKGIEPRRETQPRTSSGCLVCRAVKLLPDTETSRLEVRCQIACRQQAEVVEVIEVHRVRASDLDGLAVQFQPEEHVIVLVMELMAGGELYFR